MKKIFSLLIVALISTWTFSLSSCSKDDDSGKSTQTTIEYKSSDMMNLKSYQIGANYAYLKRIEGYPISSNGPEWDHVFLSTNKDSINNVTLIVNVMLRNEEDYITYLYYGLPRKGLGCDISRSASKGFYLQELKPNTTYYARYFICEYPYTKAYYGDIFTFTTLEE